MLSRAQIDQYSQLGFTVVHELLGASTVRTLQDELARITSGATLGSHDKSRMEMEPNQPPEGTLVRRVYEPCTHYPVFREISDSAALLDPIEQLIGPDILFHYSKINMKPPSIGSVVEWHQDLSYYPLTNPDSVTVLIYLDAASRSNGCLQVIPSRHREPLLSHSREGWFEGRVTEPVDESCAVALEGDAGSVIFMHCLTPHASVTNTSPHWRRTLILSYRAADAYPVYYGPRVTETNEGVRLVRGSYSPTARFGFTEFPMPRYPRKTSSLYELQEFSRAGLR